MLVCQNVIPFSDFDQFVYLIKTEVVEVEIVFDPEARHVEETYLYLFRLLI